MFECYLECVSFVKFKQFLSFFYSKFFISNFQYAFNEMKYHFLAIIGEKNKSVLNYKTRRKCLRKCMKYSKKLTWKNSK